MSSNHSLELQQKIRQVTSSLIFKRTINTVLKYLKLNYNLSPDHTLYLLTPDHFNNSNSINESKFSNLTSFLQFQNKNANIYKDLYQRNSKLVRTVSIIQATPLKNLNIFQIVVLVILFRHYLNHKKGKRTMREYLSSIKNGNNNSDKNIRLLYIVLISEFNQRMSIINMNRGSTYRNQILKHYSPELLTNIANLKNENLELRENENLELRKLQEELHFKQIENL
jgi:hypothetical protein